MPDNCSHLDTIRDVTPSARGCEEWLKAGSVWVHLAAMPKLRACDDSPNRHATKHFQATSHPVIEGYDAPEGWGWCYVDEVYLDLERTTPQLGHPALLLTAAVATHATPSFYNDLSVNDAMHPSSIITAGVSASREGEPRYGDLEKRLASGPVITVPTITLEGDANGAPHPDSSV